LNPDSKTSIREQALAKRRAIHDRPDRSLIIQRRVFAEIEQHSSSQVLVYVSAKTEVETRSLMEWLLERDGKLVVPYCLPEFQLGLFELHSLSELTRGAYGILEPAESLRSKRGVSPQSIERAYLPGAAFDVLGNRIGYGKGYFDRLVENFRSNCSVSALAFECQIFPVVPFDLHDRPVEAIHTESRRITTQR